MNITMNELNDMGLVAKPLKNSDFYSVSWDRKTEIKNLKIPSCFFRRKLFFLL